MRERSIDSDMHVIQEVTCEMHVMSEMHVICESWNQKQRQRLGYFRDKITDCGNPAPLQLTLQ